VNIDIVDRRLFDLTSHDFSYWLLIGHLIEYTANAIHRI